ncbi:hypothetical protein Taro_006526 [Colocasia esculenta]|uniref:Uncharacterized protein n=1 Tax=Colocasia esculenta TaxID=4460 RepID=A0A843TXV8_COLES|nr:hypothetical protein [Colocasia esculenta]
MLTPIPSLINEEDNDMLIAVPHIEEVGRTVREMPEDSSPVYAPRAMRERERERREGQGGSPLSFLLFAIKTGGGRQCPPAATAGIRGFPESHEVERRHQEAGVSLLPPAFFRAAEKSTVFTSRDPAWLVLPHFRQYAEFVLYRNGSHMPLRYHHGFTAVQADPELANADTGSTVGITPKKYGDSTTGGKAPNLVGVVRPFFQTALQSSQSLALVFKVQKSLPSAWGAPYTFIGGGEYIVPVY